MLDTLQVPVLELLAGKTVTGFMLPIWRASLGDDDSKLAAALAVMKLLEQNVIQPLTGIMLPCVRVLQPTQPGLQFASSLAVMMAMVREQVYSEGQPVICSRGACLRQSVQLRHCLITALSSRFAGNFRL